MKQECLDIGIIQAFLDAELGHAESGRVSAHIAQCDACAVMLAEAEEESAFVFSALEREFDTLVPTQRLWTKINDSIELEREARPFWEKAWAYLRFSIASPSVLAAASLLLVFGLTAILFVNKSQNDTSVAYVPSPARQTQPQSSAPAIVPVADKPMAADQDEESEPKANPKAERFNPRPETAIYRPDVKEITPARFAERAVATAPSTGYMPGEESYVKTISTLRKTVDDQKDIVLAPSERIAYERDMAIVNDTISKMRKEVKRNPRNESARQVLYSSYQNKIDLLSSVAKKEELVSSLD
jgi:hypothetical protein